MGLAAVAALLGGADAVGEPPVQQLAVTAGVRVLATGQLRRHRRAVPVVRVALAMRTAPLGEGLLLRAWRWAVQDGGCEHPKDGRRHAAVESSAVVAVAAAVAVEAAAATWRAHLGALVWGGTRIFYYAPPHGRASDVLGGIQGWTGVLGRTGVNKFPSSLSRG